MCIPSTELECTVSIAGVAMVSTPVWFAGEILIGLLYRITTVNAAYQPEMNH
jgi:hypothetical protein